MTKLGFTYGGRRQGKTATGEITQIFVDEAKDVDVTATYAALRDRLTGYTEFFVQRWPEPTQAERDCHDRFGAERAEQLIKRARRESTASRYSFIDTLETLMAHEEIARRREARIYRDLPFAVSLRGWPRRGL